jgi:hypothetical protein
VGPLSVLELRLHPARARHGYIATYAKNQGFNVGIINAEALGLGIDQTASVPHPSALAADDFPMSVGETLQTGPTDDGAGPQPPPPDQTTRDVRKGV